MERGLISAKEAARLLGVKPATIRAWVFQRFMPCVRLGRAVRFKPEDIEKIRNEGLSRERE